jgi:hypothetical protein
VKMSAGGNSRITAWRGLMASKGLSPADHAQDAETSGSNTMVEFQ